MVLRNLMSGASGLQVRCGCPRAGGVCRLVCRRSCLVGVGGFAVVVIAEQDPEGGLRSPRKTRGSAAGAVWSQTAGLAERPAVTRSGTEGSGGRRQAAVAVEQDGAPRWCAWIRLAVPPACGTLDAVSWTPGLPVCWLYCGVCQCPMGNRALPWESGKRGKDSCGASIPKACFGDVRSRRAIFMERSGKRVGQRGFMEDPRSACCRRLAAAKVFSWGMLSGMRRHRR